MPGCCWAGEPPPMPPIIDGGFLFMGDWDGGVGAPDVIGGDGIVP